MHLMVACVLLSRKKSNNNQIKINKMGMQLKHTFKGYKYCPHACISTFLDAISGRQTKEDKQLYYQA